jgi:hypothetical protein
MTGGKRRLRIRDVANAASAGDRTITVLGLDQSDAVPS